MNEAYKKQVKLLLDALPEVTKERCFALHGGTAINLFVREIPRLSVDIDLTFLELEARQVSLQAINEALARIKARLEKRSGLNIRHIANTCKLQIDQQGTSIKVEVNMVSRGLLHPASELPLCETAQNEFETFCTANVVPLAQLYGGKICAALDRQHPRDLFDIKLLLENEGFSEDIKYGFLYALCSSNRPAHELLSPNLLDQRNAFENQFAGMTTVDFSYEEYESTRLELMSAIKNALTKSDCNFLISFNELAPDWTFFPFQEFPSVKWKLENLEKFKEKRPGDYLHQLEKLKEFLTA